MAEFLAENNACGQNLLNIVSMGNSIIAEILRLKDYIPDVYRYETKPELQKYSEVIMDFSYLKIADAQEEKIEQNPELQELDDEIRINYLDLLTRFYLAFESTHQYAADLKQYLHELNNGYYIQHTMESVLQDAEGKQLMCEALYLFGVILLMLDYHIPGVVRERLLISYYRYSAAKSHGDSGIDDVCMLLRSTGFVADANVADSTHIGKQANKAVPNYPEAYFARFSFEQDYVDMVIGRLRCDDVYNQLAVYPHSEHRSTALSTQAAMLFVCLFFAPQVLHSQVAQMREIVDKFFADNWVCSIYMGMTVNLVDAWHNFKAAKAALTPVLEPNAIKGCCLLRREKMQKTLRHTYEVLREGVLTDDFVLQNVMKIIMLIRQCNVLLRWYSIHSAKVMLSFAQANSRADQVMALVRTELKYEEQELFELLLNTSQLELVVKDILRQLMQKKSERWLDFRREAAERMSDLSMAFSGSFPLAKIEQNPELQKWFSEINKHITKLSVDTPSESGRVAIQLIHTLEEVQEFHNLRANMQIKQHLQEAQEYLQRLMQIIMVREDLLINIQIISDLSYAWQLLERDFTCLMQQCIKRQPKSVIRLRAVFLKLASALEIPLLRINQAKSEDLASVSKYYSNELANYMRKVLQIIPESMFSLLARIISLQTDVVKEIPTRLEKDKIKEYAQFEDRFKISKLTHSIAVFTEGILMMQKTLVGVIELDPKQLLEDGIRKELVSHLSSSLNLALIFTTTQKTKTPSMELDKQLLMLAKTMDGYKRSFEYIQDYLNVQGLKILQEELSRVINYNVEKECNAFLRNKVQDWQSQYQSQTIPIPSLPATVGDVSKSNNFIGRLAHEILQYTDPSQTIFLQLKATWYEKRAPHKDILDMRFFAKLREAIGPAGLVGLDRLYSHMIVNELKRNMSKLEKNLTTDKMWLTALNALDAEFQETRLLAAKEVNPQKRYVAYFMRWQFVWPQILQWIMSIGHKQLLRQQLANELNRSSKCHSKNLEAALEAFSRALLSTLHQQQQQQQQQHEERTQSATADTIEIKQALLVEINQYAMFTGNFQPMDQVFLLVKCPKHIALFFFLFTIAHLSRLQFSVSTNSLIPTKPKESLDCMPFIVGFLTVFQQFNKHVLLLYLNYMSYYVTILVESNMHVKSELSTDVVTTLHFLEIFVSTAKLPRTILTERIPEVILNQYQYLAAKE